MMTTPFSGMAVNRPVAVKGPPINMRATTIARVTP